MGIGRLRAMETGRLLRAALCAFTAAFLLGALFAPDLRDGLRGLFRICILPAQLTRDYFLPELGGVCAAMLNAGLVGAICCALTFLPGAVVNGGTVLGYFLTVGFCFYGMNILNILPLMLGVAIYARIRREPLGKHLNLFMFATAVSPLVTQVLFHYPSVTETPRLTPMGVGLALVIGIVTGCAMPALCAHSPAFHKGYDLYNAGPAAGFLCAVLVAALYRAAGVEAPAITAVLGTGHRAFANAFCASAFVLCLLFGLLLNGGFGGYGALLRDSGYRSDFTAQYGAGPCLINLGVYGLCILLYYNLIGATFTGATMGAVFCMVCCACAGATPRNVLPVALGYAVMGLLNRAGVTAFALNSQAMVVGLCFASGLAPIAGEFGVVPGIVAGMLHYVLVTAVPAIHGGFNLYNGGFTAGIVCFVLVPLLETIRPGGHRGKQENQS